MACSMTRRVTLFVLGLALMYTGAFAALDESCGMPLLKAHFACQDVLTTVSTTSVTSRTNLQPALTSASGLPDGETCCEALEEIFSARWKSECACTPAMVEQTASHSASLLRRFARLAAAQCPSITGARNSWSWRRCSLANSTMPVPAAADAAPKAASTDMVIGAQSTEPPVSLPWETVVRVAAGEPEFGRRRLLQNCRGSNQYSVGFRYINTLPFCRAGFGHCTGRTCTFGTPACCPGQSCGFSGIFCCFELSQCTACFPGDATVLLESGVRQPMSQLAIGDRVQVLDPASGKTKFEEVYLFGHQLADVTATFVKATLANGRVLTLSPDHFVPAVPLGRAVLFKNTVMLRGKDLAVGMHMFTAGASESAGEAAMVSALEVSAEQGLYNPYTMGGLIVVDGVVASAHSRWVFDGVMDALGLTHKIPALYQALFAPVRALYRLLGAARMAEVAPVVADFGNALVEGEWGVVAGMLGKGVAALVGPAVAGVSAFALYHTAKAGKSKVQ